MTKKLSRAERLQLLRAHEDKTAAEVAKLLHVSEKTVLRDRQALRPDVSVDAPPSDDAVANLREQQRLLREGMKNLAPGSEQFRKSVSTLSDIEAKIHKIQQANPQSDDTEYEFICVTDSRTGFVNCVRLKDASPEVKADFARGQSDDPEEIEKYFVRQRLANEAGKRYGDTQNAATETSSYERGLLYEQWIFALQQK